MPTICDDKRATYGLHKRVSRGAGIILVNKVEEYVATFECAKRISAILGSKGLEDAGDGIFESIPVYKIPFADMADALDQLSKQVSVALVDLVCNGKEGSQFVLIHRVSKQQGPEPAKAAVNLDEF